MERTSIGKGDLVVAALLAALLVAYGAAYVWVFVLSPTAGLVLIAAHATVVAAALGSGSLRSRRKPVRPEPASSAAPDLGPWPEEPLIDLRFEPDGDRDDNVRSLAQARAQRTRRLHGQAAGRR